MNSSRFNELLDRYLADMATVEERDELMTMIQDGGHDEIIRENINTMLSDGSADHSMDPDRAREILKGILVSERGSAKIRPLWMWRRYAAAAVLLVLASAGLWFYALKPQTVNVITSVEKEAERAVFTGKQFVRLPDGSTALLNEGSTLSYVPTYGSQAREVALVGEAYFDVRHNPGKPFRVLTGKITTTVLGTTFNVTAYPEDQEVKVTVTHGKVQVNNDEHLLGIITPDQQISVNTVTYDFVQRNVVAETVSAWQSQYLILDDVSLDDAVKTIAQKYSVNVTLSSDKLKACRISATFLKGESLKQVLTVVSGVVQATYAIDRDGNARIEGPGCE